IRPGTPLSLEDARRLVEGYVEHYNDLRLNRAIGYITPKDMVAGRQQEIHAERDRKLEEARKQLQVRWEHSACRSYSACYWHRRVRCSSCRPSIHSDFPADHAAIR